MLKFNIDLAAQQYPTFSIQADSEAEYNQLVLFMKAVAQMAPGSEGKLPPWDADDKPSICYATDQDLVFHGSQVRDILKGARRCVGVKEFLEMIEDGSKPTTKLVSPLELIRNQLLGRSIQVYVCWAKGPENPNKLILFNEPDDVNFDHRIEVMKVTDLRVKHENYGFIELLLNDRYQCTVSLSKPILNFFD